MIPIYVCDDDKDMLPVLVSIINNSILIQNYDMQVICQSTDPLKIIQEKKRNHQRSIYFFDVDLNHDEYDGFSLAKLIRQMDPRGFIIFVTTHEEMMFETFKYRLEAMSYLIKEDITFTKQIKDCLDDIHHLILIEKSEVDHYYTIRVADNIFQLPTKDILYFETSSTSHYVIVHMKNRSLEFRGNLNTIEKELSSAFLRTHRSFLVQVSHIISINTSNNTIELDNGATCIMSRKGKKLLKVIGLL